MPLARWVEHFEGVLNRESTISEDAISQLPQSPIIEEMSNPPTIIEVTKAIKQMSSGKAPGADGIPPEVYKCGGNIITA